MTKRKIVDGEATKPVRKTMSVRKVVSLSAAQCDNAIRLYCREDYWQKDVLVAQEIGVNLKSLQSAMLHNADFRERYEEVELLWVQDLQSFARKIAKQSPPSPKILEMLLKAEDPDKFNEKSEVKVKLPDLPSWIKDTINKDLDEEVEELKAKAVA